MVSPIVYAACEIDFFYSAPDDELCDYHNMFSSDFVIMLYICTDESTKLHSKIVYLYF
jgi:hypothetical protein